MGIRHKKHSPIDDEGIPDGEVKPSDWNDEHDIDGLLGALIAVAVAPRVVPYLDGSGAGGTFPISDFVRGIMNGADAATVLAALGGAPLASPALTGEPTAPTALGGDASTKIATTAFVMAAIANVIATAPAALDTLNELATALGNDENFASTVTNSLALKAPLNSPALTGTPTAPTPTAGDNSGKLATTAFVAAYAPLASPALTGTPTAPTAPAGTDTTQLATTAYVVAALNRAQAIAAGTDFNTLTAEGSYYNTASCPNTPVAGASFYVHVQAGPAGGNASQRAVNLATGDSYQRVRAAGTWQPWIALGFTVGQIPATTTTTQPGTGKVGEFVGANGSITFGASGSSQQVTSITLQPGVWDVEYDGTFGGAGATTSSDWIIALGTVSANVSSGVVHAWHERSPGGADVQRQASSPRIRVAIGVATTYYLNAQATFSGSTYGVGGTIYARRV